jgi:cobalt/nickel transport protein
MRPRIGLALVVLVCSASWGRGHFHILLPDSWSARKDQGVTLTLRFGHPFEHQIFDASAPRSLVVLGPDGKKTDLTSKLEKVSLKGDKGKKVAGFRVKYKPQKRGDYVFVLRSRPVYLEDDKAFIQDTVKVVLHVQAQKGWDGDLGLSELVPLTRPYGLTPGMVFQAEMPDRSRPTLDGAARIHPLSGALAEIERYNPKPPAKLPADEQITRTVKVDRQGKLTATLPEAGWWSLTVTSPHPRKHKADGKEGPLRGRSTLWVFVDEVGK